MKTTQRFAHWNDFLRFTRSLLRIAVPVAVVYLLLRLLGFDFDKRVYQEFAWRSRIQQTAELLLYALIIDSIVSMFFGFCLNRRRFAKPTAFIITAISAAPVVLLSFCLLDEAFVAPLYMGLRLLISIPLIFGGALFILWCTRRYISFIPQSMLVNLLPVWIAFVSVGGFFAFVQYREFLVPALVLAFGNLVLIEMSKQLGFSLSSERQERYVIAAQARGHFWLLGEYFKPLSRHWLVSVKQKLPLLLGSVVILEVVFRASNKFPLKPGLGILAVEAVEKNDGQTLFILALMVIVVMQMFEFVESWVLDINRLKNDAHSEKVQQIENARAEPTGG